jgi:hypothetical protein
MIVSQVLFYVLTVKWFSFNNNNNNCAAKNEQPGTNQGTLGLDQVRFSKMMRFD